MYVEYNSSTFCRKTCIKIAATAAKFTHIHTHHYIFNDGWYVRLMSYLCPATVSRSQISSPTSFCVLLFIKACRVKALYHWVSVDPSFRNGTVPSSSSGTCNVNSSVRKQAELKSLKQSIRLCLNDLKHIVVGLLTLLGLHLYSRCHICGVKPALHNLPLMKNRQIGRGLIFLSDGSLTSPSSRSSSCPQNTNHNMSESSRVLLTDHKAFGSKSGLILVLNICYFYMRCKSQRTRF